ncbi:hypothetical protein CYPRO_2792 [Cyclonatronum proteinivorum]|uniref:Uncharacterized protein n=1 Tax=Cyclonatronum proteinivorum TaxID=1457365 RepID=A0A345UNH9_9BACT|nr:hypothetical protein [Cyclonatronum proteinivorum]AXJ02031.1 hypothetical protein CYPRO_2792 [Cyclonatronum proteinivorum]
MHTDIFKLIFEHDLRLEQLSGEADPRREQQRASTLEEFLKPVPVYSKFYFTGTCFENGSEPRFGFTRLQAFDRLFDGFLKAIAPRLWIGQNGMLPGADSSATWQPSKPGETLVLCSTEAAEQWAREGSNISPDLFTPALSVREKIAHMTPVLDAGCLVLFTEQAHDGLDLHLFSKANIYEAFFERYQPLTGSPGLRYFSINGKRARSERLFYFETWTLDRPPHGFEEVFPETRLR